MKKLGRALSVLGVGFVYYLLTGSLDMSLLLVILLGYFEIFKKQKV